MRAGIGSALLVVVLVVVVGSAGYAAGRVSMVAAPAEVENASVGASDAGAMRGVATATKEGGEVAGSQELVASVDPARRGVLFSYNNRPRAELRIQGAGTWPALSLMDAQGKQSGLFSLSGPVWVAGFAGAETSKKVVVCFTAPDDDVSLVRNGGARFERFEPVP